MRISILLPRYPWHPSGGYIVAYRYASELAARGHSLAVLHPRRLPAGGWPAARGVRGKLRRGGARLRDLVARPHVGWSAIDPRVQLLYVPYLSARHVPDADVIIATWWSTVEAALRLPASKGALHHLIQGYEVWHGASERVHAVWRAPVPKIVIATWLIERGLDLGVPRTLMTHVPNAIDPDTFAVQAPIETRPRRVAMLFSRDSMKGGELGLEMLHRAREQLPDLTAFLFGGEPAPSGLPEWITYEHRARPARLAHAFNGCAVYLCPSLSEGWHLPPAEAMACGCAVVSADIGGVRDYAHEGATAYLYPAGDVQAGAERLTTLLQDEPARVRLARNAVAKIATFSWVRSTDLLESVLQRNARI